MRFRSSVILVSDMRICLMPSPVDFVSKQQQPEYKYSKRYIITLFMCGGFCYRVRPVVPDFPLQEDIGNK